MVKLKTKIPDWIKKDVSLGQSNTFRIKTKTSYLAIISNKKQLIKSLQWAKANSLPFFILGNGSNILFAGEKYPGLIIKIRNNRIRKIDSQTIIAPAGIMLELLLENLLKWNIKD